MPQKLETVLKHVEEIKSDVNRQLIYEYYKHLVSRDTSTNYQKDNVKLIYLLAKFLGESKSFIDVKDTETIAAFLDTRRKSKDEDPEQKWITTWNDYLWRLKMFYRWLYNARLKDNNYQRNYYSRFTSLFILISNTFSSFSIIFSLISIGISKGCCDHSFIHSLIFFKLVSASRLTDPSISCAAIEERISIASIINESGFGTSNALGPDNI